MDVRKNQIYFLSTECYPVAKVGGLGDVVGSLPKYINKLNAVVTVIMPKYDLPWFENRTCTPIYENGFTIGGENVTFTIEKIEGDPLGFPLLVVNIPGKFDRKGVYADENGHFFLDESERYVAFARAVLDWIIDDIEQPDLIHCHDHHTGLIPFMMQHCFKYRSLSTTPVVFTIHNERYQGAFGWGKQYLLPEFDTWKSGLLDWNKMINPLASAVKCSWKVSTVSPSYMEELKNNSFGLEWLFRNEEEKSRGILNGIDNDFWNPKTDDFIAVPLKRSIPKFKRENKIALLEGTELDADLPVISFIGRFALEKGADFLPGVIDSCMAKKLDVQFIVLGTGDKTMESHLEAVGQKFPSRAKIYVDYNEQLAHQMYAGSDFIIMPSRVEPCGLNQMYSMRYGTIPIVHNLGGLKDSVNDIEDEKEGTGIKIYGLDYSSIVGAIIRAKQLYEDDKKRDELINKIMKIDNSWDKSARKYMDMYEEIL